MGESKTHRNAKTKGLSKPRKEVPISRNRRLDARDNEVAREVERSGSRSGIKKAISRLNTQKNRRKELLVPNPDLDKAKEIAEQTAKGKLTIQNISRTKRRFKK